MVLPDGAAPDKPGAVRSAAQSFSDAASVARLAGLRSEESKLAAEPAWPAAEQSALTLALREAARLAQRVSPRPLAELSLRLESAAPAFVLEAEARER